MKPPEQIAEYIANLDDWRGERLAKLRQIIAEADSKLVEGWKWNVPVWATSDHKLVCAVSAFKDHVKINFFQGAKLADPHKLLNNGFDSKAHRSIDFTEASEVNEPALRELIQEALNI